MFTTALVPVDDSAAQGPLLDCLTDLRAMGVSRVILTDVVRPQEAAQYARWPVMARAALDAVADEITAAGGMAEVYPATGKPSQEIARAAAERNADLIVDGKMARDGWRAR